jgi:RNA polymerase sigma-70 factor (ECF subfamily)
MSAFYGRTAREIGDIEGIPLGTAKTRIRTGLQKLREAFEMTNDR